MSRSLLGNACWPLFWPEIGSRFGRNRPHTELRLGTSVEPHSLSPRFRAFGPGLDSEVSELRLSPRVLCETEIAAKRGSLPEGGPVVPPPPPPGRHVRRRHGTRAARPAAHEAGGALSAHEGPRLEGEPTSAHTTGSQSRHALGARTRAISAHALGRLRACTRGTRRGLARRPHIRGMHLWHAIRACNMHSNNATPSNVHENSQGRDAHQQGSEELQAGLWLQQTPPT